MVQANYDDMLRRRLVYKDVGLRPGLFCPAHSGPMSSDLAQWTGFWTHSPGQIWARIGEARPLQALHHLIFWTPATPPVLVDPAWV